MRKVILFLAALSLSSQAFAMQTTELVPASNQPVDPADLAVYNGDFIRWTTCLINSGKHSTYIKDSRYNPFIKDVNAARDAASDWKNNRAKFLQYRASSADKAALMVPTYGCEMKLTPLSTERR